MTRIVFTDTEATNLDPDTREITEAAFIIRDPGQLDREVEIVIEDADFTFANVRSLEIGGAYQRHPRFGAPKRTGDGAPLYLSQAEAAVVIERETRHAQIIGQVVNFDAFNYETLLKRHGLPWSGYYDMINPDQLIVGYLRGQRSAGRDVPDPGLPPWDSDELSRMVGVEPPGEGVRHTALGDARWVRDLWDVVMSDQLTS